MSNASGIGEGLSLSALQAHLWEISLHRALMAICQTNAVLSLDTTRRCYGAPGRVGRLASEGLWLEPEPLALDPRLTGYLESLIRQGSVADMNEADGVPEE